MTTLIIIFFLVFTGGLAIAVVIASTMLDRRGSKICSKCGNYMKFLGIRGRNVYYKCTKCGKVKKEKYVIEHEQNEDL